MPFASLLAGKEQPARGDLLLGGRLLCYRVYACADGHVSMGALEPKFWAAFCRGVGREDLIGHQFDAPGSPAHAEVSAVLASRTRAEWEAFNAEHDCCVEPVLDVAEVASDEQVRARGMIAGDLLATPVKLTEAPASFSGSVPGLGEHTGEVLREAGYEDGELAALRDAGAIR
jgi:crotonobetainyl-CoA:carnitine CoA-transferase CaiB-like acyl-CoA transferase